MAWSTTKTLGVVGIGLLCWYSYTRYKLGTSITFGIPTNISLAGSVLEPVVTLTLPVHNPTPYSSTVHQVNGSVYLNGTQKIADIVTNLNATIVANGDTNITIPLDLNTGGVISAIANAMNGNASYLFDGNVTIDYVPVPLRFTFSV